MSGGLLKDLKPNAEIKLRGTDYVIRNEALYTTRLRIYLDGYGETPEERPISKAQILSIIEEMKEQLLDLVGSVSKLE